MSTFSLNCLLLGEDSRKFFTVKHPQNDNISLLRDAIKLEKSPYLNHLPASRLILWKLTTPKPLSCEASALTESLRALQIPDSLMDTTSEGNGEVQLLQPLKRVSYYWMNGPMPEHLHILVQEPSDIQSPGTLNQFLLLNCLFIGDDSKKIFIVKVPRDENVSLLKDRIKENKSSRLDHLDASDLVLYKVSIPFVDVDSPLKDAVDTHSKWNSIVILPLQILEDVFSESLQKGHVHILIDRPHPEGSSSVGLTISRNLELHQVANAREQFFKLRPATAPSTGARPKEFRRGQEKARIYCNRPCDNAKSLPLSLSHPVFGEFADDCKSYKPTSKDKIFFEQFVEAMAEIYDTEKDRQAAIVELFCTAGIFMQASKIIGTDYMTDGSMFFRGSFLYLLAELKNEIYFTDCEPYLQSVLYYLEASRWPAPQYPNSSLPCIILLVFGPFIAFAGAAWAGSPNVQMLSLP